MARVGELYRGGAIRTRYKDILFRSKLEADWARCFDALELPWEYEKEGRYFGDVFYLPDFWLPCSRQHVEVKPTACETPHDVRKWLALCTHDERCRFLEESPDFRLIVAREDGSFFGYSAQQRPRDEQELWTAGLPPRDLSDFVLNCCAAVALAQCASCREWWFLDPDWGWQCQCCGHHAGKHTFLELFTSPLPDWPLPAKAA